MATPEQIDQLRRMTALNASDDVYTADVLALYIDNLGTLESAAGAIWNEKAASLSGLVDVTESGSSRKLSQLAEHARKMAGHFDPDTDDGEAGLGMSFTVGTERV